MKKRNIPILVALVFLVLVTIAEEFIPGWDGTEASEWLSLIEIIGIAVLAYIYGKAS